MLLSRLRRVSLGGEGARNISELNGCFLCGVRRIKWKMIGSAIANAQPRYYGPGYVAYDGYGAPYPSGCPGGYWARVPVYDPYGNVVGYRGRPRYFCP